MLRTKVFKKGNSQAVQPPLAGVMAEFAKFSPDFIADGRGTQEQAERKTL